MKIEYRKELIKEAGVFDALATLFSSVFDKNDIAGSIAKIATNTVLAYYFGLPWAILVAILQYGFNTNVVSLLDTLVKVVSNFFMGNGDKPVDADKTAEHLADETINEANLPEHQLDAPISPELLSSATNNSELVKEAAAAGFVASWLGKTQGGFIKKMLVTIIKALLVGGGIGMVGSAMAGGIKSTQNDQPAQPNQPDQPDQPGQTQPPRTVNILDYVGLPSTYGSEFHSNDANKNDEGAMAWYVQNDKGDVARMIWDWIFKVYPNMEDAVADAIQQSYLRAVSPVISVFKQFNDDLSSASIRMPNKINNKLIHSKKDVVDIVLGLMVVRVN